MTKVVGRWTFKAGGDYRVDLLNLRDLVNGTPALGQVATNTTAWLSTINGSSSTLITDPGLQGIAFASFLTGVGGYNLHSRPTVPPAIAAKYMALFSQNDWKVTNKLTINLGLRYEIQPGPTERYNRISDLDLTKPNPYATGVSLSNPLGGIGDHRLPRNEWLLSQLLEHGVEQHLSPVSEWPTSSAETPVLRGGYGRIVYP